MGRGGAEVEVAGRTAVLLCTEAAPTARCAAAPNYASQMRPRARLPPPCPPARPAALGRLGAATAVKIMKELAKVMQASYGPPPQ